MKIIRQWLNHMFSSRDFEQRELASAYYTTFSTQHGQMVLQHLMDTVYCAISESTDANEAIALNAQRSVVHRIIENIEFGMNFSKYETTSEVQNGSLV